jgi:hypothetical protein
MNHEKFSNPQNFSGIWFKLHLDAAYATTSELKRAFYLNTENLVKNFKCLNCKGHFEKYWEENSILKYQNIRNEGGKDIGYFKWTWEFHNAVNRRLGKKEVPFDEAYEYFSSNEAGICELCGGPDHGPSVPSVPSVLSVPSEKPPKIIREKPSTSFKFVSGSNKKK